PSKTTKDQSRKSALSDYGRYSSLAFQMIAIILVGVFGGVKLDKIVKWEFPVFTLVLTILAVLMSMYYAVKDLIRKK
ncbi:MAG: AtpZ/AtpI family protein, partial [Bacteroidales bacterium]|nr:AtpZ/AtpI family protein [Bacteroidales bacterium]